MYSSWIKDGPDGCFYNVSSNGWMEIPQFYEWFQKVFIEFVKAFEGPKILVLDGHKSHITSDIVQLARSNQISIICLPPHSTHILQPLDIAVFKPAKSAWRKILDDHNGLTFETITKEIFPSLLRKLVESNLAFLRRHAVAGFESIGVYSVNRSAISDDRIKTLTVVGDRHVYTKNLGVDVGVGVKIHLRLHLRIFCSFTPKIGCRIHLF